MLTTKLVTSGTNCRTTLKKVLCELFDVHENTWFQIIETDENFFIQQLDERLLNTICIQPANMKGQLAVNIPRHLLKNRSFTLEPLVSWQVVDNKLYGMIKKAYNA
jgi:hypothetical protein